VSLARQLEDAQLADAQRRDAQRAKDAAFLQQIASASALIGGRKADTSPYQNADPNGQTRAVMQALGVAQGRRAEDAAAASAKRAEAKALSDDKYRTEKEKREAEEFKARLQHEASEGAKGRALQREIARMNGKGAGNPKELPAGETAEMADLGTVDATADKLFSEYKEKASDYGSGLMSMIPGTDANIYRDNKLLQAKAIGRSIEGGRMTDADAQQYFKMMPDPWDTDKAAKSKIDNLKAYAREKRNRRLKEYEAAGYDMSRFKATPGAKAVVERRPAADGRGTLVKYSDGSIGREK
jgi:hypothetical protein